MTRLLVACAAAWLIAMFGLSSPSAVGDASEYVAMAGNLASLQPPGVNEVDRQRFAQRETRSPRGFELETRRMPELLGPDGRQDMPHAWLYAACAVPGVWAARLFGVHDAWGFVVLHAGMLLWLLRLALRDGAGPWTLLVCVNPLVWWIDKPSADLFIAALIAAAILQWPTHRAASLVWIGIAAGQNPALGVAWVLFTGAALATTTGTAASAVRRAALLGGACAAITPAYYLWHLGRLSPLTSYTTPHVPSITSLLFPITDINMGALVRFAPGALAAAVVLLRQDGWRAPAATPAWLTAAGLLAVMSQQPNRNNGGHPDLSRYVLWLWPLLLPWLRSMDARRTRASIGTGLAFLLAAAVWSTIEFRPPMPERYRYPTALAAWLWRTYPSATSPIPESFAERLAHREPAWVPIGTPGCEKVLLYEATWPVTCPPAEDAPAACSAPGTFCYANRTSEGRVQFSLIGPAPGVALPQTMRRWDRVDGVTTWLATHLRRGFVEGADPAGLSVRAAHGLAWSQTWSDGERLLIYGRDAVEGARLMVRHDGALEVTIRTPEGGARDALHPASSGLTRMPLPRAPHVLVELRRHHGS